MKRCLFPLAPRHCDRTPSRSPLDVVEVHRDVAPLLAAAVSDDLAGRSLAVPVKESQLRGWSCWLWAV